jgi:hypothetical protein
MTVLDPKTKWGWNKRAMDVWLSHYPHVQWINSSSKSPAAEVICHKEGLLVGAGFLVSIESCRSDQFEEYFHNQMGIDFKKLIDGYDMASTLKVPLIFFIYFEDDNSLMNLTIWRPKNGFTTDFWSSPKDSDHKQIEASETIIMIDCSIAPLLRG